jgi:hypothetical protein
VRRAPGPLGGEPGKLGLTERLLDFLLLALLMQCDAFPKRQSGVLMRFKRVSMRDMRLFHRRLAVAVRLVLLDARLRRAPPRPGPGNAQPN